MASVHVVSVANIIVPVDMMVLKWGLVRGIDLESGENSYAIDKQK